MATGLQKGVIAIMNNIITFIYNTISSIIHAKSKTHGRRRSETGNRERQEKASRRIDRKRKKNNRRIQCRIRTCKESILCSNLSKENIEEPWPVKNRINMLSLKKRLSIIPLFILYIDMLDTYPAYAIFCMSQLIQTSIYNRSNV